MPKRRQEPGREGAHGVFRDELRYWKFGYDYRGQVNWGKLYFDGGSPEDEGDDVLAPGYDFEYEFDDIGNRLSWEFQVHAPRRFHVRA